MPSPGPPAVSSDSGIRRVTCRPRLAHSAFAAVVAPISQLKRLSEQVTGTYARAVKKDDDAILALLDQRLNQLQKAHRAFSSLKIECRSDFYVRSVSAHRAWRGPHTAHYQRQLLHFLRR